MGGFANRFETVNRDFGGPVEEAGKEMGTVQQEARTCPSCGNEFSGAMEFCPVCMLRGALPGAAESGVSSFEDAVKPTSDQPVQQFDHYELVTGEDGKPVELGHGAMGVTYKAFDINLRCPVTLKVITERYLGDESARLRFLREARAAASVRHPNVASVFHLGRTGSSYFYAMEFVEGETLENLIRRSGRLEVKLAMEIATQVAAGLAAVHEQHLVHRDIKPTNIMVRLKEEGGVKAKIIDLGLAKTVDESASEAGISSPGAFAGTPEFASPEQFAGVGVDIRSDLYSLGVTLWVMASGQTPFRGTSAEVMYQHQHAPLPLEGLKDVPQPVVVLIKKLLEKDPAKRFQTPDELLKAIPTITGVIDARRRITRRSLQPLGEGKAGLDAKRPAIQTAPRGETPDTRRGLAALFAGVAALLILAAAGGWYVLGGRLIKPAQAAHLSVVVLPFTNLSGDPSQDYFADGVTENLTDRPLAHPQQLRHRPQHRLHLQRQSHRRQGDRQGARRPLRARRLSAARPESGAGQRAADRRRIWRRHLGRPVRGGHGGSVQAAGSSGGAIGQRPALRARHGRSGEGVQRAKSGRHRSGDARVGAPAVVVAQQGPG